MTKYVCKISRLNSKRLLRKLHKILGGYFILPHPVQGTPVCQAPVVIRRSTMVCFGPFGPYLISAVHSRTFAHCRRMRINGPCLCRRHAGICYHASKWPGHGNGALDQLHCKDPWLDGYSNRLKLNEYKTQVIWLGTR